MYPVMVPLIKAIRKPRNVKKKISYIDKMVTAAKKPTNGLRSAKFF